MEYHITTSTHGRTGFFRDPQVAYSFCRCLHSLASEGRIQPLCWVLMPDHFHVLLRLEHAHNLSDTLRTLKGRSARDCNAVMQRSGPVWQRGYFDRALRQTDDRLAIARYIVANPLRAGLVQRIGDYPYWDCVWLGD